MVDDELTAAVEQLQQARPAVRGLENLLLLDPDHRQPPDAELYGLQIAHASGLPPGTIYPILQRLRAAGWVVDRWEDPDCSQTQGRPPRRYYRLSVEGRARAVHALQRTGRDLSGLARLLAPQPGPTGIDPLSQDGRA